MKKSFIICLTMSLSLNAAIHAQQKKLSKQQVFDNAPSLTQPINDVIGWSDDNHYIEMDKARKMFAVEVATGAKTPYTPPPKSNVKVFSKDNDVYIQYGVQEAKKLTDNKDEEKNPTLSPDGKYVAFTRNNDLHAVAVEG